VKEAGGVGKRGGGMRKRSRRKGGGVIMGAVVRERVDAEKRRSWCEGRGGGVSGEEEG
jgi:hypothetical protein